MTKHNVPFIDTYQLIYGQKITIQNLNEMAVELSRIAGRSQPWTGKFLHSLIKGYAGFSASERLTEALKVLNARINGQDEIQAQSKQTMVSAVNNLPAGTIVLGQAQRCTTPGCPVLFVPTHPTSKISQ